MSPVLIVDETHYSPYDDVPAAMLARVGQATTDVRISAYGFTYAPLIDLLIALHAKGVKVRVLADHSQAEGTAEKPQLQRLADARIDELLIGTSSKGQIDHEKVIIVDGALGPMAPGSCVLFGSYNFSASAELQDNTLSIRSAAEIVAAFLANWQLVHNDMAGKHPEWQIVPAVTP